MRLRDGRTYQGDIVIGSDGLHSRATRHVVGYDSKVSPSGVSAFRFVVPTERLKDIDGIDKVFTPNEGAARHSIDRKGRIMVWSRSHRYAEAPGNCGGWNLITTRDALQTFTLIFPDNEKIASKEGEKSFSS